ncbi:hypothetical protein [Falsiroseomonas oryzae]|uniref:hypothetical protein n=1 Tax=Falsiroseomonas oryzae TaxID=2766473 RepID=UPI0022EA2BF9|nr:hypothetical protein [Roseomonas sp. MO-31]
MGRGPWLVALMLVVGTLLAPLAVVDVPPLLDYPNHLARMAILAGQAPELTNYYAVQWGILPNLAMDLVVPPLAAVLPLQMAGRLMLALAVLLPVLGTVAYHRAVFGVRSWWPLGSALVAYNGLFLLGFINFQAGMGVALLAAAGWIALRGSRPLAATLLLAVAGVAAFFCHLAAVAFLFGLVATHEAGVAWAGRRDPRTALRQLAVRAALSLLALLPALAFYLMSPIGPDALAPPAELTAMQRLRNAGIPVAGYAAWIDRASLLLLLAVPALLLLLRRASVHPGTALAFAACLVLYAVVPTQSHGGYYVELRFAVFAAFLLFAGLQPILLPRASAVLAGGAALLLAVRLMVIGAAWQHFAGELAALRRAMEPIAPGARVATVKVEETLGGAYWRDGRARRILSFLWLRTDTHLGALVVAERGAMWPSLFALRGQQPLVATGPFVDFIAGQWFALPERPILTAPHTLAGRANPVAVRSWHGWETRFDYVLLLHAQLVGGARGFDDPRLELVRDAGFAALYRVRRPMPAS